MPAPLIAGVIALGTRAGTFILNRLFMSAATHTVINKLDPAPLANGEFLQEPIQIANMAASPFKLTGRASTLADILRPPALLKPQPLPNSCTPWAPR